MTEQSNLEEFTKMSTNEELSGTSDWNWKSIEEMCIINPSSINDGFDYDEMKYLNISSTGKGYIHEFQHHDVEDAPSRAKRTVAPGDSVISTVRPGREQYVYMNNPDDNVVVSTGFVVLRPKDEEKLDNKFLYYAATRPEIIKYFESNATGSAYPAANLSVIRDGEIPVPPIREQRKIAKTLSNIDEKVAVNTRIVDLLEETVQSLYNSWFVDFDPFDKFKDSKLGQIPVEFEVDDLTTIAEVTYGDSFDSSNFNEEKKGYPVIRNGDLPNETIEYSTDKYLDKNIESAYEVLPGDLVVTMDRYFDPYIWKGEKAALNQRICKFEGVSEEYSAIFLYHLVKDPIDKLERAKTGTTLPHLGKSDIENIEVIVPDTVSLMKFNDLVRPMYQKIIELPRENRYLADLRDTLHPKLMSGEMKLNPDNNNKSESII